ncbi:MAG: MBOAT family protein [Clostridia bacterium]|nr:MBOAT family protein [Clostridia bacterium]
MLFSSITFIYFFLPLTALYFLVPQKWKNAFLLLVSLIFYFSGEPVYISLLFISSVSDWLHGLYIESHRGKKSAKVALISAIVINVLLLGIFKYTDFIIATINTVFNLSIPLTGIVLPIGISFFTFQTMSYTIDVYRGEAHAQKNLISFATFVCLFPQLIAGPIVRYTDVAKELEERSSTIEKVSDGIRRFCVGLGKKVLIANLLGELCADFSQSQDKSVLFYWVYAIAFSLQIYFDFSGYSDMAIGLGKIFGFNFPENFNYPYISRSVTEFWRRWHMTLGGWFRDYVYIPLGGNRVSKLKWVRNIAVVWLLTGIWHGAQWNFVLWGAFFGVVLLIEKLCISKWLSRLPSFVGVVYTSLLVVLNFVVFNANGLAGVIKDFKGLFGVGDIPMVSYEALYNLKSYAFVMIIAIIGCTPYPRMLWEKVTKKAAVVLEPLGAAALLVISTAFIVNGSFNPFLYFRF